MAVASKKQPPARRGHRCGAVDVHSNLQCKRHAGHAGDHRAVFDNGMEFDWSSHTHCSCWRSGGWPCCGCGEEVDG